MITRGRPWLGVIPGPAEVTGDQMVAAMDSVDVDGAILVSASNTYGCDPSYAVSVRDAYPDRFALVTPVDCTDPADGDTIGAWAETDGAVGIRLLMRGNVPNDAGDPGIVRVLTAAARHALPVNVAIWGRYKQVETMAAKNPDIAFVIDHVGLDQPFAPPPPAEPRADLPTVLAVARYPNVTIKLTGACTLSHEPFPFADIWGPLEQVIGAFQLERCM